MHAACGVECRQLLGEQCAPSARVHARRRIDEPEVLSPREQQAQERQRTLTTAVGLVQQGMTFRAAAEATGIARSTLWEAWQSLVDPDAVDRDERRKQADESIMAGSYGVATAGLARMARDIETVRPPHPPFG